MADSKTLKRCYKCKEHKHPTDFHKGATMCVDCRKEYDFARSDRFSVRKDTVRELLITMELLSEKVDYIISRIDKMDIAALSNTETSSEEEKPLKKDTKKSKKNKKYYSSSEES